MSATGTGVRAENLHPQFGVARRRCASCRAAPGRRGRRRHSGAEPSRRASSVATTCGTCETRATLRSCSSAVIVDRQRAEVEREVLDEARRARVAVSGDHPGATDEEVGAGRDRSPAFATGHRVRADVARRRRRPRAVSSARMPALTLATSVTMASGRPRVRPRPTSAVTSGGTRRRRGSGASSVRPQRDRRRSRWRGAGWPVTRRARITSTPARDERVADARAEQPGADDAHRAGDATQLGVALGVDCRRRLEPRRSSARRRPRHPRDGQQLAEFHLSEVAGVSRRERAEVQRTELATHELDAPGDRRRRASGARCGCGPSAA